MSLVFVYLVLKDISADLFARVREHRERYLYISLYISVYLYLSYLYIQFDLDTMLHDEGVEEYHSWPVCPGLSLYIFISLSFMSLYPV